MSITGFVKPKHKWSKDGLLDHVLDLVVCEDKVSFKNGCMETYSRHAQAFQLVDKPEFRQLLQYQRPETKENEIPHHTKCQEVILKKAEEAKASLHAKLEVSLVCMTDAQ